MTEGARALQKQQQQQKNEVCMVANSGHPGATRKAGTCFVVYSIGGEHCDACVTPRTDRTKRACPTPRPAGRVYFYYPLSRGRPRSGLSSGGAAIRPRL